LTSQKLNFYLKLVKNCDLTVNAESEKKSGHVVRKIFQKKKSIWKIGLNRRRAHVFHSARLTVMPDCSIDLFALQLEKNGLTHCSRRIFKWFMAKCRYAPRRISGSKMV